MAVQINRLTGPEIRAKKKKGLYADGNGLYLQVSTYETKSWIFRFSHNGKARQMGLGPIDLIPLAEARDEAIRCRKLLRNGIDPIIERENGRNERKLDAAKVMTFRACAEAYIRAQAPSWKNVKHGKQWKSTLETYVYPIFGDISISAVDINLVTQVLEPIWATKTETASRVRGRIEAILDWATVRQYREGENPARWRGHLDKILPARNKVRKVKHHEALPYEDVPAFMADLDKQEGYAAHGLRFIILTAARTGEVLGARWDEIDWDKGVWTIPAERMKADKEHRVPLSTPVIELLKSIPRVSETGFIFPGRQIGHPLSNMAFAQLLKRMGRGNITVHGFRSSFRDWAAERTAYPSEIAEMALAHTVSDKVEAAYRRGDLLQKRFNLMDDWAAYCHAPPIDDDNIVMLDRRAR